MPRNNRLEFPSFEAFENDVEYFISELPNIAAISAVNFFMDRFQQKGWIDQGFTPWQKRKNDHLGSLMVQTGNLRDSFDHDIGDNWVEVTNYAPYSSIHNEGGYINVRVTPKSRKFFWYMYKKTGLAQWKHMARTKKTAFKIKIPKRQFMGHSDFFMQRLDKNTKHMITQITKKHLK